MNVFDIVGPVMVGPSSSHTAGAVRIGRIVRKLLGEELNNVLIMLHGSFARTYKGHGTDKAILAGLMEMDTDDLRIRDSLMIANRKGINFRFEVIDLKDAHPNTVLIEATGASGKTVKVMGSSIGGGNILINQINGLDVEFTGQYNTLIIRHEDIPGSIAAVTNILGNDKEINIAYMKVYRTTRGGDAIMVIETDQQISNILKESVNTLPMVYSVTSIEPIS